MFLPQGVHAVQYKKPRAPSVLCYWLYIVIKQCNFDALTKQAGSIKSLRGLHLINNIPLLNVAIVAHVENLNPDNEHYK